MPLAPNDSEVGTLRHRGPLGGMVTVGWGQGRAVRPLPRGVGRWPLTSRCRRPARSSSCSRLCSSSSRRPLRSSRGRSWDAPGAPEPPRTAKGQGPGVGPAPRRRGQGGARVWDWAGRWRAGPRAHLAPQALALQSELLLRLLVQTPHLPLVLALPPGGGGGGGVGDGVRQLHGACPYRSPSPAPRPALTAAAPAPGRLALGPPPPGRPTHASARPPSIPAARVARAAAGSRAAAPPAAWKSGRGLKPKWGLRARPRDDLRGPGPARRMGRLQGLPPVGDFAPARGLRVRRWLGSEGSCVGGAVPGCRGPRPCAPRRPTAALTAAS